ncbi:hypothetical protein [Halostagnicola sp. A-GB9-2]|uniref:hypothetical protein n=1 Tax=Halostagnicola sp. A-GB9-2 TaxID=3048066 RepID=UPI0024C09522|nr:hypothetical protein [Halostagnicola sp. A-GB9-2]MDJ1434767.1 hypothetical protein [Halostagnicola sp. A-GB9-2]
MPSYSLVFEAEDPLQTPIGETDHIAIDGVDPINIEPRHSAMGIWSIDTAGVTDEQAQAVEQFAAAKARTKIYISDAHYEYDNLALTPGPLHNTSYNEETGELGLEGEDAAYYLLADSDDIHYENESVPNALRDYWSRVDGFDAQVDDPEPRLIAEGVLIQSPIDEESFGELIELVDGDETDLDTQPVGISDGNEHLRTCRVVDLGGDVSGEMYSGGEAADTPLDTTISFDYTIPGEYLGIAVRQGIYEGAADIAITLDGETVVDPFAVDSNSEVSWQDLSAFHNLDEFQSGVLGIQDVENADGSFVADVVAVFDTRKHDVDNFDNEVHEANGYLNRPWEYSTVELTTEDTDAGSHIADAGLSVEMDNTDEDQRIQLSFDGGETWHPDNGSEDNTDSIRVENDATATVSVTARIRLSGHSPNGARDATPRFGYAGQTLESWTLDADLSSLGVIEDDRFDDDHLSNLQELHSRGDYRFTLIPDESTEDTQVRSYQRGTWEINGLVWHALSRNRNRTTEDYWNVVTVKGPRDDETGERPVTTREDEDEIERVGEELKKTEIRNDLDTEADRATVATQELLEAVDATDVTGEIEAAPTLILPGPRYYVDGWGWVDLEDVRFSDQYGDGNVQLTFDKRAMLVDRLSSTQNDLSHEKR